MHRAFSVILLMGRRIASVAAIAITSRIPPLLCLLVKDIALAIRYKGKGLVFV
jgi:hypothetical protein